MAPQIPQASIPRASLVPGMVPDEVLAPLWRESITPYFDAQPIGAAGTPTIHQYHLGRALFADTTFSAQHFRRDPRWMARNDDADHLMLQLYVRGTNGGINGSNTFLEKPGNIYAVNLAFDTDAKSTDAEVQTLILPRDLLMEELAHLVDASGALFPDESASALIFSDHMLSLRRHLRAAPAAEIPVIMQATIGLLDSLSTHGDVESTVARSATLRTLCRYIDDNLRDPMLGVDSLCRHFRCSRATLYRLFSPLGGVRDHIQRRRLMACFKAISGPGQRRIYDIALDFGFVSPSHFSTLFRAHFGITPREARDAGLQRAGLSTRIELVTAGYSPAEDIELMWHWGKTLARGAAE
jgi:AraC-like DNA-binding protein